MVRYSWVGIVVVAMVMAAGFGGGHKSASATEDRYDSEEIHLLHLINDYRHNNGVGPLLLSDTISVAAEHHSKDMANYSFFAHNTLKSSYYPAGSQPWDRMRAEGYDYNTLMAENIAVGCQSARRCFELWRNSPSHNAAMLDESYRVMGVGRLYVEGSVHGWYWSTDFGGRVDPTAHTADNKSAPPLPQKEKEEEEDGLGLENGQMESKAVWDQEARDEAQLILENEGYARLGDYDKGRDELRQKIRIEEEEEEEGEEEEEESSSDLLTYRIKIESEEVIHPSDYLVVQLEDSKGERIGIVRRYTDEDAGGGWSQERVDLSRFAGRSVYLSFLMETDELFTTAFYLDDVALKENREST